MLFVLNNCIKFVNNKTLIADFLMDRLVTHMMYGNSRVTSFSASLPTFPNADFLTRR